MLETLGTNELDDAGMTQLTDASESQHEARMAELERVVQVRYLDRIFTFTVDVDPPLRFWRVATEGFPDLPLPVRVVGSEEPAFSSR